MSTRQRPTNCCQPKAVRPLTERGAERVGSVLNALGDRTRLEILRFVAGQTGPVCACDIVDRFDLSQPTVSHHMKLLLQTGLLTRERSVLWMIYTLAPDARERLDELSSLLPEQG